MALKERRRGNTPNDTFYREKAAFWASECDYCGADIATITETATVDHLVVIAMRVKTCTNTACTKNYDAVDGSIRYYVTNGKFAKILETSDEINEAVEAMCRAAEEEIDAATRPH